MPNKTMLITGGAGFIGVNACVHFFKQDWDLIVLDNLSRKGADINLAWLQNNLGFRFIKGDVRDAELIDRIFRESRPDVAIHLAGQVAVTTSVQDPRTDFEINALGTLNMLEGIRHNSPGTFLINASTNKVYGKMETMALLERERKYEYALQVNGIPESQPLDFHSPYGCSKGAADQYTIDYSRIYGLHAVTLRQSCIYGPHQMGIEDQGWVAWFIIAALSNRPITIYGNGKQVRDILHVHDLIDCYQKAIERRSRISGQAFNVGGGPENTLSLLELLGLLTQLTGKTLDPQLKGWRPGDQPVFVCDIGKAKTLLTWKPATATRLGIETLVDWFRLNGGIHQS